MINGQRIELSDETVKQFETKLGLKKQPTYDDIAKEMFSNDMYYFIDRFGDVRHALPSYVRAADPNNSKTKEQLESILALNKLCNVAKYLNGDWLPDWNYGLQKKFYISMINSKIQTDYVFKKISSDVYFKSEESAQQAIEILGEDEIRKALTLNH